MSPVSCRQLEFESEDDTRAFARALAPMLAQGDAILLAGDIGSGKSLFARAVIQCLMMRELVSEDVPSPTYTLVQSYEVDGLAIWHADLYRLVDRAEVVELGLDEAFLSSLCLVEWPDRLGDAVPGDALTITLSVTKNLGRRAVRLDWRADNWAHRIDRALADRCG